MLDKLCSVCLAWGQIAYGGFCFTRFVTPVYGAVMERMYRGKNVAGVILAGGPGKRMGGRKKAFLEVGGVRNVNRLLATYQRVFDEIILAVRDPKGFEQLGVVLAEDRLAVRSSLTGIHAGLGAARAEHVFVSACDAPFLRSELAVALLQEVRPDRDVVIPLKEDGYMEPLCAVYSKACLEHMAQQLASGDCKIIRFFDKVRVHTVPVHRLRKADPDLLSFMNMNTPRDLAAARALVERQGGA